MIISNTEVTTFNTCQRQHYFRFGLQVEPKFTTLSKAIQRGIVGHKCLEAYYLALKSGESFENAKKITFVILNDEIAKIVNEFPDEFELIQTLVDLKRILEGYFEVYRNETFEVLEVESFFSAPVGPGIEYGMKLDVLACMTSGEFKGDLVVVDHKFVYNFKTMAELEMDGQLAKYVQTCRANGHYVSKGIFNQLRYRVLKDPNPANLYRRDMVKATAREREQIWKEQLIAAERIEKFNLMGKDAWSANAVRNLNPLVCRGCFFQKLCKEELQGNDIQNTLVLNYQPNTYGYSDLNED